MDRSGAMPRRGWFEIRDEHGRLLHSIPAHIEGGGVSAELPVFPPGSMGTIQLCTDQEGEIYREETERQELPATPQIMVVQLG
jgi:hypothetical protein